MVVLVCCGGGGGGACVRVRARACGVSVFVCVCFNVFFVLFLLCVRACTRAYVCLDARARPLLPKLKTHMYTNL